MIELPKATVITKFKIRSNSVVFYPSFELFSCVRGYNPKSQENLLDGRVKGYLSAASSRKIRDMVENWVNACKADQLRTKKSLDSYLSFVTLTLPSKQVHSDKQIKRDCLNSFLIYSKRRFKIKNFVWKCEPQKNGNIHFHILFDRFVPWQEIRHLWIKTIEPLGYIEKFYQKHGHRNPNCTDIHGLYKDQSGQKINFVGAYLAKYLSKREKIEAGNTSAGKKDRPIDGRLWGCSDNLKSLECFRGFDDSETDKFFESLKNCDSLGDFSGEYFRIFTGEWFKVASQNPEIMRKMDAFYLSQYKKINDLIE